MGALLLVGKPVIENTQALCRCLPIYLPACPVGCVTEGRIKGASAQSAHRGFVHDPPPPRGIKVPPPSIIQPPPPLQQQPLVRIVVGVVTELGFAFRSGDFTTLLRVQGEQHILLVEASKQAAALSKQAAATKVFFETPWLKPASKELKTTAEQMLIMCNKFLSRSSRSLMAVLYHIRVLKALEGALARRARAGQLFGRFLIPTPGMGSLTR